MTSEEITNPSIRDMIRELSQANVNTGTMPGQPVNSYTPRNPFTVNYCGIKNVMPDHISSEPPMLNSSIVTFVKEQPKLDTIRDKLPQIQLREDNSLVFYRKKGQSYRKMKSFENDLKEMTKRKRGNSLVLYLYVQSDQVDNDEEQILGDDYAADDEVQNNGDDPRQVTYVDDFQPVRDETDEVLIGSNSPTHSNISFSGSESDLIRPQSIGVTLRVPLYADEIGFSMGGLPDPGDIFKWEECTETPVGKELNLEDVSESDFSNVSQFVEEVKLMPKIMEEEMDVDANPSAEMNSKWSVVKLLEKGSKLTQEFEDFMSESKMSTELLTFLCLMAASEAVETTHLVTPKEVKNIQNNVPPYGPDQNVKNIIILNSDLSCIALVERDNDSGEYYLNNILTIDNSKYYVSKLLIRDVCNNLCIDVNYSETVCENFIKFNSEEGDELTNLSLFFSARNMLRLNPPVSLTELEGLVEIAHSRVKEFKQTSKLDTDIDWYTNFVNSRKRNREDDT